MLIELKKVIIKELLSSRVLFNILIAHQEPKPKLICIHKPFSVHYRCFRVIYDSQEKACDL